MQMNDNREVWRAEGGGVTIFSSFSLASCCRLSLSSPQLISVHGPSRTFCKLTASLSTSAPLNPILERRPYAGAIARGRGSVLGSFLAPFLAPFLETFSGPFHEPFREPFPGRFSTPLPDVFGGAAAFLPRG